MCSARYVQTLLELRRALQVQVMVAGRELDALVAESRMGWRRLREDDPSSIVPPDLYEQWKEAASRNKAIVFDQNRVYLPHFSTEIGAGWTVLERLLQENVHVSVEGTDEGNWRVWVDRSGSTGGRTSASGVDVPYLICVAALRSLGWG